MIYKYPSKIFSHEHSLYLVHPLNIITPIATTSSEIKSLVFISVNFYNNNKNFPHPELVEGCILLPWLRQAQSAEIYLVEEFLYLVGKVLLHFLAVTGLGETSLAGFLVIDIEAFANFAHCEHNFVGRNKRLHTAQSH